MKRPIHWRWIFTFLPLLCCLVFDPRLMSGHFVPKSFWAAATLSIGFLVVWPRRGESLRPSLIGGLWLAWLAWSLFSMLWAPQKMVVIDRCASLFVLPALACILARRTRFWESDTFWLALSLLVILIGAAGALLYAQDYVIRFLDAFFPSCTIGFMDFTAVFPGTAQPRVTFGQRNVGSMFMLTVVPFLAWRYFRAKGPGAIISGLALGAGLFFILIARTRGAWVGAAVAAACAALAGAHRPLLARKPKLIVLATCALLVLAAAVVSRPAASLRLTGEKASVEDTLKHVADDASRLELFRDAIRRTPPLLGAGCGNYPILSTPYTRSGNPRTLNWEIHNDFIQAYADTGILGLLLMLAFVAALLTTAWRRRTDGIVLAAGLSVAGLIIMLNTTYIMEKVSTQLWMAHVIAILISTCASPRRTQGEGRGHHEEHEEHEGGGDVSVFVELGRDKSEIRPYYPRVLTNTLIILYLLLFTAIIGITYYADWRLRSAETLIVNMRIMPPMRRAHTSAGLAKEVPYLANKLHPMIQFNLKNKHVYGHLFASYTLSGGHRAAACAFARTALATQPA
ncbi:MAG: hypothetical protein HN919_13920, partial [Verrucomicrobia bacterium]|nr:hypothetical protein [Verrucomicrobiota bacterium]